MGCLSEDTQNKQPIPVSSLLGDMVAELPRAETKVHQRSQEQPGRPEHALALPPVEACICLGQSCPGRYWGNSASCKEINPGSSRGPARTAGLCYKPAHTGTHHWPCLWAWRPLTSWSGILGERRKDEQLSFADAAGVLPMGLILPEEPVL